MKAPAFWYQPPGLKAKLLSPFAKLYETLAVLRRLIARPYRSPLPVICVGNVVAGGSGKTPTALALAELLQKNGHKPVFVTRGYGGSQRGPLQVNTAHHGASEVGDEALLLVRQAPVWIARDRAAAIRKAEKTATHILLDDGLQNPNIKPHISLLVIDGSTGFGNGHILPAGPLREPLSEALKRTTAIVIVGEGHVGDLGKPVVRARLRPVMPPDFPQAAKFLAFAGIGRPEKFYKLCRDVGLNLAKTVDFADHHPFTADELNTLERMAQELGAQLLTTEKDYVRLPAAFQKRVRTLPIRLEFDDPATVKKLVLG